MKSAERGFTLIELIIAMLIIMIISMGFLGWASTIIQSNLAVERNNTAYTMALDIADRLQRMADNALIQPKTGNAKYIGYEGTTDLDSDGQTMDLNFCSGTPPSATSIPSININTTTTGLTALTNPWNTGAGLLYYYDNNACSSTALWDACKATISSIQTGANARIDHPNTTTESSTYHIDSISPIRSYRNTTYYAVWSVAYMPCNAGTNTDKRKIFITVYWIDPESADTTIAAVQAGITSGAYVVKSVSLVVDKTIGVE